MICSTSVIISTFVFVFILTLMFMVILTLTGGDLKKAFIILLFAIIPVILFQYNIIQFFSFLCGS